MFASVGNITIDVLHLPIDCKTFILHKKLPLDLLQKCLLLLNYSSLCIYKVNGKKFLHTLKFQSS